jgi:hypothetical protein
VIYDEKVWNSDKWNAKDYWQEFDFNRSFFEQFDELLHKVPLSAKIALDCENSDYCSACWYMKNCYLCFNAWPCENSYYSVDIVNTNNSMDCYCIVDSENCYECVVAFNCYDVQYSYDVKNCRNSKFLLNCNWCKDCYWCFNLENKQYYIFNEEYSKEEYFKKLENYWLLPLWKQKEKFENFYEWKYIKNHLPNIGSENVFNSENITNSKNIFHSKNLKDTEDFRYSQQFQYGGNKLWMDVSSYWWNMEKVYYSLAVWENISNSQFIIASFANISNLIYCIFCSRWTNNCFGCIGLENSSYCVLNKQYTKKEYEKLVPKIIEHMQKTWEWWEFFPAKLSPHWYNDVIAQNINPLNKEEAIKQGFNWSDYESLLPKVEKIINAKLLPDDITKIPDDILNRAIKCEITGRPFLIIKQELEFYRKHNLPIPKRHPDQRQLDRLKWHSNY